MVVPPLLVDCPDVELKTLLDPERLRADLAHEVLVLPAVDFKFRGVFRGVS
jgi:hypothetical protein